MGGNCCLESRKDSDAGNNAAGSAATGVRAASLAQGVKASVMMGIGAEDADKVDEAFDSMDMAKFVALLHSDCAVKHGQQEDIPPHPWAAAPTCVGALVATEMAVLASEDSGKATEAGEAGAVETLVDSLKKGAAEDQLDAAALALHMLTSLDPACSQRLAAKKGAIQRLVELMGDSGAPLGRRAALSTAATNAALEDEGASAAFAAAGGPQKMLAALEEASKARAQDFISELLENLDEMAESATDVLRGALRQAISAKPATLEALAINKMASPASAELAGRLLALNA